MKKEAIEKIKNEQKEAKKLSNKANAIKKATCKALISFCNQEEEFAQAILDQDKTIADCLESIAKGIGNAVSDIEVFEKAVQFYFPGAKIEFVMKIDLCGSVLQSAPDADEQHEKPKSNVLELDFGSFFGGI